MVNIEDISRIPIFTGLSQEELQQIQQHCRLTLEHSRKGRDLAMEYTKSDKLICVIDGWVEAVTYSDDRAYRMEELIEGPLMLEPDKLFGMTRSYRSSYRTHNVCSLISISKEYLMWIFDNYLVVRLNYLNLICHKAQQQEKMMWKKNTQSYEQRVIQFIKRRCIYPNGHKMLYIKMSQMAEEINASRQDVSNVLNKLDDDEKIILKRGIVDIPNIQLL